MAKDKEIPNPPAFPTVYQNQDGTIQHLEGMGLRDYFAAKALTTFDFGQLAGYYEDYAKSAYMMADAMLKERSKH